MKLRKEGATKADVCMSAFYFLFDSVVCQISFCINPLDACLKHAGVTNDGCHCGMVLAAIQSIKKYHGTRQNAKKVEVIVFSRVQDSV